MNWQQFQAYVWLRWRLLNNQWRRGGAVNFVLMTIIAAGIVIMSIPICIGCFVAGWYLFPEAKPTHLMYTWDVLVLAFLAWWCLGLLADVQQSESLSLTRFLHLPVSVGGAFFINYLSSLVCLSMLAFVPVFVGLSLALVVTRGILALLVIPLTLSFLLMVSAVSNQIQSWMTALMSNPRRRRAVVVGVTALLILIAQIPNLINMYRPFGSAFNELDKQHHARITDLTEQLKASKINLEQFNQLSEQSLQQRNEANAQSWNKTTDFWSRNIYNLNLLLPIGWLPWGVMRLADGNAVAALLGTSAMTLIGMLSLRRAYRTTLRHYQGFASARPQKEKATATVIDVGTRRGDRLAAHIPGLSEPVSAVALSGAWTLIRSPEAKMMLMTPLIMAGVFASIVLKAPRDMPEMARPLLGIGAFGVVMFGVQQLMANQFGFDRNGFRVFVLSAASRRDILVGKNLSFAPLVFGMAMVLLVCAEVFSPMRWTHLLAMAPQYVMMYLLFCGLMNFMSIYTPYPLAAGSLKPAKPKLTVVLLQFVIFCSMFPLLQLPTLLPLGIEALADSFGYTAGLPICLFLTIAECFAVIWLYRKVVEWQGSLLQNGEQRILEVVTGRAT